MRGSTSSEYDAPSTVTLIRVIDISWGPLGHGECSCAVRCRFDDTRQGSQRSDLATGPNRGRCDVPDERGPSGSVVDTALKGGQPLALAAPSQRDDLGRDADRGLLRGARAEVEPDRRRQVRELVVGE